MKGRRKEGRPRLKNGVSRCGPGGFGLFRSATSQKNPSLSDPPFLASTTAAHCFPKMGLVGGGAPRGNEGRERSVFSLLFSLHLSRVASAIYSIRYPTKATGMLFFLFAFLFLRRFLSSVHKIQQIPNLLSLESARAGRTPLLDNFKSFVLKNPIVRKPEVEKRRCKKKISERSGGEMPMEILPHILAGKKEMGKALSGTQRIFFQRHAIKRKGGRRIQKIFQPQAKRASINFIMGSLKVAGRRKRPEDQFLFHFGAKSHLMHFVPPSLHCRRRLGGQTENIDFVIRNLYPPFLCFLSYISFPPPLLSFRREKVSLDFSAVWDPEGGKLRSRKEEEEEDRPTDRPSSLPFSSLGRHIRNILERDSPMTRNALYPYMPLANPLCKSFLFEQLLPHVVAELGVHIYW